MRVLLFPRRKLELLGSLAMLFCVIGLLALLFNAAPALATQSADPVQRADTPVGITFDTVHYDELIDETGRLRGGSLRLPVTSPGGLVRWANVRGQGGMQDGPVGNRIDLVVVGDGYTEAELGQFAIDGEAIVLEIFAQQPLARYRNFFNVHYVDVISNESGVDNDPTLGVRRDTALDMGFWCSGIERLLCVDVGKAYDFARNAPDVDHVLAIANSSKYGGAGYIQADLATASARNIWSPEVALHEYGHSFGNLADEYWTRGAVYEGPELPEPNVSIYDETQMAQRGDKWARWLGVNRPDFDGLVSTYEGARYHEFGIYRPTDNSKMRSLARPFNPPSAESWVIEFYKIVRPIDDATPDGTILSGTEVVFVDPVDPVDRPLDIQWFLDGGAIDGASGEALNLSTLQLEPGSMHELSVTVVDSSGWVRDEDARAQWMTESRNWLIETVLAGDLNCDGAVNSFDIEPFLLALLNPNLYAEQYPDCNINAADVNGDGAIDAFDIEPFLDLLFGP